MIKIVAVLCFGALSLSACAADLWIKRMAEVPTFGAVNLAHIEVIRQDYEKLHAGRSVIGTPLLIGTRRFEHGLGTHSVSVIRVYSEQPIVRFSAWVGVDKNGSTTIGQGSVSFSVVEAGKTLTETGVMRCPQEPARIDTAVNGSKIIELHVGDGGDGPGYDHADWADAMITLEGGKTMWLDEMMVGTGSPEPQLPFSFNYDGKPSNQLMDQWTQSSETKKLDDDRTLTSVAWTDPSTGLKVTLDAIRYSDFPAVEWLMHMENTGTKDTPVIDSVQNLDLTVDAPMPGARPYVLHKSKGGIPNPTGFEPSTAVIDKDRPQTMGAGNGRSSTVNFPFFKLETGMGSYIVAIGWSGCWESKVESADGKNLRMTAGLQQTHFVLHPGEKVRMPRILMLRWAGDTLESNAQFRQLIYKHFAAKLSGKAPLPTVFCNTCFTRGGGWLNECNEQNQISLINAYAPLGLEAVMTDAGWFTGGWPEGAGNWDPRKDAYPNGMGPVAAAAKAKGMTYGLWFEPERVVAGTDTHKTHPQWCLPSQKDPEGTYLLNFGLPEVQDYFFNIVKGFMELPGFRVYRQDFNMDPLPYWRFNDAPDRQGITEMKYIEGLYAYWDRILSSYPDCLMEECASGGHRIDLETVARLHIAQKTDYWFDDENDQQALWSVSQYLPNNAIVAHLNNLDEYSFRSTFASSLCLGWIADDPKFNSKLGKAYITRYKELRHLLVGAWYPLLPYTVYHDPLLSRQTDMWVWDASDHDRSQGKSVAWIGSQYHRADLNEGMLLIFRQPESPYKTATVKLHALDPNATYKLTFDSAKKKLEAKGDALMQGLDITLPEKRSSELVHYAKVK